MARVTITHEFDYYEEQHEISHLVNSREYYICLYDVDQALRDKLKNGDEKWLDEGGYDYIESVREMIHDAGVFRND